MTIFSDRLRFLYEQIGSPKPDIMPDDIYLHWNAGKQHGKIW